MAELAKVLNTPRPFHFEGQTYQIGGFTLDHYAAFEAWLESQAWLKVERTRGKVDAQAYRERHDAMTRLIGSGEYARGSDAYDVALRSVDGFRYVVWLAFSERQPVEISLVERMLKEKRDELIALVNELNTPAPNAGAPAQP